jgi:hypothetical protein
MNLSLKMYVIWLHCHPIYRTILQYTYMALVAGRYQGLFARRSDISHGQSPREIWLLRVNKASYLPTTRAIHNVYRNYTQNNKTFLKTNLTFYSICVVVYVNGYIAAIRKMKIETKHSTTWEIFFCVHLYMASPWGHTAVGYMILISPEHTVYRDTWSFAFLACDVFLTNHRHSYIYEV